MKYSYPNAVVRATHRTSPNPSRYFKRLSLCGASDTPVSIDLVRHLDWA